MSATLKGVSRAIAIALPATSNRLLTTLAKEPSLCSCKTASCIRKTVRERAAGATLANSSSLCAIPSKALERMLETIVLLFRAAVIDWIARVRARVNLTPIVVCRLNRASLNWEMEPPRVSFSC